MNPEELKRLNEEREKKEREAIEQIEMEREGRERKALERIEEREGREQEDFEKRKKEREKEERNAIERVEQEESDAIKRLQERERQEQEEIIKRLKQREKEEEEANKRRIEREAKEEAQRKLIEKKEQRQLRILRKQQSERLFASPREIGSTEVNTHSGTLPVYYVIIGRGPAAIINHTTLRQSEFGKERINALPVMHIGFANPWTKYMQHGMGQPPHLLNLPGFKEHPREDAIHDAGLDSKHFGDCVESEYSRLESRYEGKVFTTEAWVIWIQSKAGLEELRNDTEAELEKDGMTEEFIDRIVEKLGKEFQSETAAFRLLVMNSKPIEELKDEDLFFIYASYIDICTGPGRPNVGTLRPVSNETAEYKKARTPAWLSPEKWEGSWGDNLKTRTILNGVEAIRDEVKWTADERICVTAGGGVGLNAAERSRNEDCKLDWFGRSSLMPTFANPRNDTFLRHPTEKRILRPGESKKIGWTKDDDLIPCGEKLRCGYGAVLEKAELADNKIEVSLKRYIAVGRFEKEPKIKDYFRTQVDLSDSMWSCSYAYVTAIEQTPSKLYDRLVLPNGQASKALGHAYYFARHLTLTPITETDGRMIALKSADGKVRVLGAAAQTYDNYGIGQRRVTDNAGKKMWLFWDSLPVSAVPDGMIFSGVNIAVANQYFSDEKPNKNVNTATQKDLEKILKDFYGEEDAEILAKLIINRRKRPINGCEDISQVINAIKANEEGNEIDLYGNAPLRDINNLLTVKYTPSRESDLLDDV